MALFLPTKESGILCLVKLMKWHPLVSVILPTWNRAKYLPQAMDSVLSQDYRYLELIVVDDGSTDETGQIVNAYKDDRIC